MKRAWLRRRRTLVAVGLAAAIALLLIAYTLNRDPAYVGTSRRITLTWGECFNGIGWPPVKKGHYWWAGDSPTPTGPIETGLTDSANGTEHVARGTMHFVSRSEAVFTSSAGGTLAFRRESTKSFHNASCLMGFNTNTTRP